MDPINNMNPMPQTSPMPEAPQKQSSSGAIWAIVIILAVVLAGGAYFWGERIGTDSDRELDMINTQSSSDEAAAIEADLEATDVENVDYDLDEANFNAS